MTGAKVRVEFDDDAVKSAVQKGGVKALRSAGAYTRKAARNAVARSSKASPAGSPPHTRRGLLKRSILFGVEKHRMAVVIGPAESLIGISMTAHEFGGMYRRRKYPRRPLMGPTLEKVAPQLPKLWAESVKP
ncbi:MAG: hypothetical protein PHW17_13065 [Desulfobacterales bacterium]|nr:hypothetical protein [Desulfobacterales bacterium]MDD3951056.1 hypothetical protein [Desulfobacterales bacterium]